LTTKSIDERSTTMADRPSMPSAELVAKTLLDEHADVLREPVTTAARDDCGGTPPGRR
jgi:hypothetical protein